MSQRRPCTRCDALRSALERERTIHAAEVALLNILEPFPPDRARAILLAAAALLEVPGVTLELLDQAVGEAATRDAVAALEPHVPAARRNGFMR